jgi:hypothetical protein
MLSKANGLGGGRRIPLSDISAQDTDVQLRGDRHVNPDVDGTLFVCVRMSRPFNRGELVIAERGEARPILGRELAEGLESVVSYRWDNGQHEGQRQYYADNDLHRWSPLAHGTRSCSVDQGQQVMLSLLASFRTSKPPAVVTAAAPDKNSHNSTGLLANRTREDSK